MNIFVTSESPIQSAKDHCDVHLRKMIVELAQLLSTAHAELDKTIVGYKPTHKNHPCAIWVRESSGNYFWAYQHFISLCVEYRKRFNKTHKTAALIDVLQPLPRNIQRSERTTFAMAMPDNYKVLGIMDETKAYKAYLNQKFKEWTSRAKPIKVQWTNRVKPDWVEQ